MWLRRILYLLTWLGCAVFFWAYRLWLSWYLLAALTCLPVFSLLVSLPAMLTARLEVSLPDAVTVGTPVTPQLHCRSFLPAPLWRCRIRVRCPLSNQRFVLRKGRALPTEHCGGIICSFHRLRVYDYLGLFCLPMRSVPERKLLVRPNPVAMEKTPEPGSVPLWRPKPGGGFSENHDLRLYRPGDPIQQIHWKLSGKTGKLILREPMEPIRQRVLLRLKLFGTPQELDRMLGRLLWLGETLLARNIPFEIRSLTGCGGQCHKVANYAQLLHALDELLCSPCMSDGSKEHPAVAAGWHYDIGGGTDGA